MPNFDSRCIDCGHEEGITVRGGTHPPCSRCQGPTEYVWRAVSHGIQTDEAFIGGQVIENLGNEPVTVYSRTELRQEMARRGLEQRIKYVPGDKYLTNWALGIDPQTMRNAEALVARASRPSSPEPQPLRVDISMRSLSDV